MESGVKKRKVKFAFNISTKQCIFNFRWYIVCTNLWPAEVSCKTQMSCLNFIARLWFWNSKDSRDSEVIGDRWRQPQEILKASSPGLTLPKQDSAGWDFKIEFFLNLAEGTKGVFSTLLQSFVASVLLPHQYKLSKPDSLTKWLKKTWINTDSNVFMRKLKNSSSVWQL